MTTLMAIGAQGYSIGRAIRTLLGEVLDVMYFKKWQTIDLERRVRAAAFANALGFFEYPGAYLWVADKRIT
ncbi:hypothetical protein RND15_51970, partial [Streptomyces sp. DSM 41529]|nr:hypothetical protein [Streptomyces sp. DSM 41529]